MIAAFRQFAGRRAIVALFAAAVLAAQALALVHELDLDGHDPGQICDVCLAAASLGSANLSSSGLATAIAAPEQITAAADVRPVHFAPYRARARAPPLAS